MSYNRIRTPRAYIDSISRDLSSGWRDSSALTTVRTDGSSFTLSKGHLLDLFDLKPHKYIVIPKETKEFYIQLDTGYFSDFLGESNFIAILGHNMHSANVNFKVQIADSASMSSNVQVVSDEDYTGHTKIHNVVSDADNSWISPQENGWSLFTWTDSGDSSSDNKFIRITISEDDDAGDNFADDLYIGAIMYGEYLDFPANADVGYSISYDYDANSTQRSIGGSDYSTIANYGAPMWAYTPAWINTTINTGSVSTEPYTFGVRSGRKKVSMNFSNVSDTSVFSQNEHSMTDYLDSANFHGSLYQRLAGSHLPFLFSYDNTSTDSGSYGLYRLANGLNTKQVAANTFNFKIDLEEAW